MFTKSYCPLGSSQSTSTCAVISGGVYLRTTLKSLSFYSAKVFYKTGRNKAALGAQFWHCEQSSSFSVVFSDLSFWEANTHSFSFTPCCKWGSWKLNVSVRPDPASSEVWINVLGRSYWALCQGSLKGAISILAVFSVKPQMQRLINDHYRRNYVTFGGRIPRKWKDNLL